jgi:chromatin remodeling complex protein RSC6
MPKVSSTPKVASKQTEEQTASAPASATPKVAKAPKAEKQTAPATTAVSAPATSETVKKTAEKKEKAPKVAVAPVVAVTAEASSTEQASAPAQEVSAPSEFTDFMTKLQQLGNMVNTLKSEFRTLEKKANKDLKLVAKANARRKRKNVNRAPSGFVKPTLISAELASFLGKTVGTEMARTDVTREINTYIREHQLQDKSNGRIINADSQLSSLLKVPDGEKLTYFNLQRYMSPHFTKTAPVVTA